MASEKRLIDANALMLEPDPWGGMNGVLIMGRSGGKTMALVQKSLRAMIQNAPTVDAVEVVHGRWEDGECTACGFDIRDMIDGESEFRSWVWECVPYCPNCGAKMDGDGNG